LIIEIYKNAVFKIFLPAVKTLAVNKASHVAIVCWLNYPFPCNWQQQSCEGCLEDAGKDYRNCSV